MAAVATHRNSIGGQWVDAAGGQTFESVDPATGDVLGVFQAERLRLGSGLDPAVDVGPVVNRAALDFYTEWKSLYVDYSGRLQRAQIDNQ